MQIRSWAGVLDVLFIAIYVHFYLAVYLHRALKWHWALAWLGVPLFLLLSQGLSIGWRQIVPGSAGGCLSAWTILVVLCAHSAWKGFPSRRALAAAETCFVISLSLRLLDMPLSSDWRWGTHFVWHVLNAATLGLTTWAMVQLHLTPVVKK